MKITYHTTGFLSEARYTSGLRCFLQQYDGRFPGIEYLHLELSETTTKQVFARPDPPLYSSNGRMLKIHLEQLNGINKPGPYEVYSELRNLFDQAVEAHLKNHQHDFRYAPEL